MTRTTGLVVLAGLIVAGCGRGGSGEMRVGASRIEFNTVSDLAQIADFVFSGRIGRGGGISRTPEPKAEVPGDRSPQVFAYALVSIVVDEVITTRDPAAGLPARLQAGAPTGFAIVDPDLIGTPNFEKLKKEYRVLAQVPKSGAEGIFFASSHTLGSAGDGFEIVGFAASSDKKLGRFDDGVGGRLAGSSLPYEEIVSTSKTEFSRTRAAAG